MAIVLNYKTQVKNKLIQYLFHAVGLFTADQVLSGDIPIYTRQNPGGARFGYEVPEERDYYPYWGPTPWKDIVIMVSNNKTMNLMKRYVQSPYYRYKCEFSRPPWL